VAAAPSVDAAPSAPSVPVAAALPTAPAEADGAAAGEPRAEYREIVVPRGTSLNALALQYFGSTNPALVARIRDLNPQIHHVDRILAGDTLRLPEPAAAATTTTSRRR
jgi:nucleoid-associated protein YgaU